MDITKYQNTNTIVHIDNPKHWKVLEPLIWSKLNLEYQNDGTLCIWLHTKTKSYNSYGDLKYALNSGFYNDFNIIKSSEILNNQKTYELW